MIQLQVCPSTLADGFNTYSPEAKKRLFDGKAVSHYMKVPSPSTDSKEANQECSPSFQSWYYAIPRKMKPALSSLSHARMVIIYTK